MKMKQNNILCLLEALEGMKAKREDSKVKYLYRLSSATVLRDARLLEVNE